MQFDVASYPGLKEKGSARIVKVTEKVQQVAIRRFDPTSGEETDPLVVPVTSQILDQLQKDAELTLAQSQAAVEAIKMLRADTNL